MGQGCSLCLMFAAAAAGQRTNGAQSNRATKDLTPHLVRGPRGDSEISSARAPLPLKPARAAPTSRAVGGWMWDFFFVCYRSLFSLSVSLILSLHSVAPCAEQVTCECMKVKQICERNDRALPVVAVPLCAVHSFLCSALCVWGRGGENG